jgi:hypothetical protein
VGARLEGNVFSAGQAETWMDCFRSTAALLPNNSPELSPPVYVNQLVAINLMSVTSHIPDLCGLDLRMVKEKHRHMDGESQ